MSKRRVTVTVEGDLLDEAVTAVEQGRAESVSGWIAEAMADRRARDRRLAHLAALIAEHEEDHGVITADELAEQAQADRDAAAAVRATSRRAR
jgi:hypothetical protein